MIGREVEGREVVVHGLCPADQLVGAVLFEQDFCRSELTVVVVAHREAVSAGVVDIDQVIGQDLGQHAVNGKFVVVLAQTACHVVLEIAGVVLLAEHGDVVVGAVHRGAHEVGGAGIQTDVVLVDVLGVQAGRDQRAVGSHHVSAKLGEDRDVIHARGGQDLLILLADEITDDHDVVGRLFGAVIDADAAGEVDEADVHAAAVSETDGELEQDGRELRVILVTYSIGR